MLNDHDEKYQGTEESEYHFSDDDVSYEVESETPTAATKPAAAGAPATSKDSLVNMLAGKKRLLVSIGVFFVLVFVVYKMVAPTSTPTTTEIVPSVTTAQQATQPVLAPEPPIPPQAPPMTVTPAQPPLATAPAPTTPTPPALQASAPPVQPPVVAPSAPSAPTMTQNVVQAAPPMSPSPAYPQALPQGTAPIVQPVASVPAVLPQTITSPPPQQPSAPAPTPSTQTLTIQAPAESAARIQTQIPNISAENAKLIAQLQAEYITRVNDFVNQNKNLQEQVETLSARVATMESELNQLLQALTRQSTAARAQPPVQTVVVEQAASPKVAYNVQAIIPGRAWLRSDSGETVTVAEGDNVKGLGRVTKIDPYDGIVEINTGSKVISLSYGTGG